MKPLIGGNRLENSQRNAWKSNGNKTAGIGVDILAAGSGVLALGVEEIGSANTENTHTGTKFGALVKDTKGASSAIIDQTTENTVQKSAVSLGTGIDVGDLLVAAGDLSITALV